MSLSLISPVITEEHFAEIVKKKGGVYRSWAFEGGTVKKGDAYLSEVFKVIVTGEDDKG
jgi:hypothetical protein